MTNEMTPADIAAVTGGNRSNGMFGGDGAWWIIVLFLFAMFGWGGNGYGNNNGGASPYLTSAATQADIQRGFDQSSLTCKLDALTSTVSNGFASAEVARCNAQANLMSQLNSIAMAQQNCCCENRAAIADVKYSLATEACDNRATVTNGVRDIIDSQTAGFRAILDKMCQQEIDTLKSRNADLLADVNALRFAQSQTAQNAFISNALNAQTAILNPTPIPAYVVQNPNCCNTSGCGTCGGICG